MKSFKIFSIILILTITFNCTSQNINTLSYTDYSQVKINNTLFSDLNNTNGDEQQVKNLSFNFMNYSEYEDPELSREFNNTLMGLNFRFEDKTDSGNNYKIAYLKITNSNSNIKLKNTTLSVGDNIDQITNIELNPTENGKVAYFRKQDSNDSFIVWTDSNGVIQSIEYNHY